jgi:hypothetical protein
MAWPTTTNPRTEFVTLRLTVDEAADLDWLIVQTGSKDRSDCLRKGLDRLVAAEKRRAKRVKQSSTPGPGMRDPESRHDDTQDGVE